MPWKSFIKALLDYARLDIRGGLQAEAPLSPRSPLANICSPTSTVRSGHFKAPGAPATLSSAADGDSPLGRINDIPNGTPDSPCHQTFLYLDFLSSDLHSKGRTWGVDAVRHLSHASQPAALLVLDPDGAILTDPRAIREIAAALAALHEGPTTSRGRFESTAVVPATAVEPVVPFSVSSAAAPPPAATGASDGTPLPAAAASVEEGALSKKLSSIRGSVGAGTAATGFGHGGGDGAAEASSRLHVASGLRAGDWVSVAAAFGRLSAAAASAGDTESDDDRGWPAATLPAVVDAVLEAARQQYIQYLPLLCLYTSRASVSLDAECAGMLLLADDERQLLTGGKTDCRRRNDQSQAAAAVPRGAGPSSQDSVARVSRNPSAAKLARPAAPSVPPTDPETLDMARRLHGAPGRPTGQQERRISGAVPTASPAGACADGDVSSAASARHVVIFSAGSGSGAAASGAVGPGGNSDSGSAGDDAAGPCAAGTSDNGNCGQVSSSRTVCAASGGTAAPAADLSGPTAGTRPSALGPGLGPAGASMGGCREPLRRWSTYMSGLDINMTASTAGGADALVAHAVEAARRYAALLEGRGLLASAQAVLESCICSAGERWGHRSAHAAAALSQLGRVQALQGLHREAEVTWRQALEATEASSGPTSARTLLCQVALARVLAHLQHSDAESLLRSALTSLDSALGPTAAETLQARCVLGELLAQAGRWAEAEVVYQSLLQTYESEGQRRQGEQQQQQQQQQGGQQSGQGWGLPGDGSSGVQSSLRRCASHRSLSRPPSRQHLLAVAPSDSPTSGAAGAGASGVAGWVGNGGNVASSGSYPRGLGGSRQLDTRSFVTSSASSPEGTASGFGEPASGTSAAAAGPPAAAQWGGLPALRSSPHSALQLPPLSSCGAAPAGASAAAACSPPGQGPPPSFQNGLSWSSASPRFARAGAVTSPSAAGSAGQVATTGGGLSPCGADPLLWSAAAAALADVVAAVQREYGGVNELYDGMHLAGPEGTVAADLAAAAAVCPRSGACLTAVVNVRRVTDPQALYDAALSMRRAALGSCRHPSFIDLQLQHVRHLVAAGEHARAEAACRAAMEMLPPGSYLPEPGQGQGVCGGDNSGTAGVAVRGYSSHPAEVAVRHALGSVLLAAGLLPAAASAIAAATSLADRLVASGDMAAADARRLEALDSLAEAFWRRGTAATAATDSAGHDGAAARPRGAAAAAGRAHLARAGEVKRTAIELIAAVYGEQHERTMRSWTALGQILEAAGDLAGAEHAFEAAAEVALHRHSRLSSATKAIFRQLQRVYEAQGRTADAQLLSHMYRLKGGLLSSTRQM